jgi:hypothetical protein
MKTPLFVESPMNATTCFHSIHSTKIQRNIENLVEIENSWWVRSAGCGPLAEKEAWPDAYYSFTMPDTGLAGSAAKLVGIMAQLLAKKG